MTTSKLILAIFSMAIVIFLTRAIPFIFYYKKTPPKAILYLGANLPPAMMVIITVYSLKDVAWMQFSGILPTLLAIVTVVTLHLWKRNYLLSIIIGTLVYMFLVQLIF
ncbi:MAG: AzlD domain-containing protein [Clostridia bacterium]